MKSMKNEYQVHKCVSINVESSLAQFCVYCGVYISRSADAPKYYRSIKYDVIDSFKTDENAVLSEMIKKQCINRSYNPNNRFINCRSDLISFLRFFSERLDYSFRTFYLGISILDNFLTQHDVQNNKLKFIAFICLNMAAKMEENSDKIPQVEVIARLFEGKTNIEELQEWEIAIFKSLGYNLNIKTSYLFVHHLLSKGVIDELDAVKSPDNDIDIILNRFENLVMSFLDLSLRQYEFYRYSPIVVASAAIACARKACGFAEYWPKDLQELTSVYQEDIGTCFQSLYHLYYDNSYNNIIAKDDNRDITINTCLLTKSGNFGNANQKSKIRDSKNTKYSANKTAIGETDEESQSIPKLRIKCA